MLASWFGGDPTTPSSGSVYYYLVTAENEGGVETGAGHWTDGTPRVLDPDDTYSL